MSEKHIRCLETLMLFLLNTYFYLVRKAHTMFGNISFGVAKILKSKSEKHIRCLETQDLFKMFPHYEAPAS